MYFKDNEDLKYCTKYFTKIKKRNAEEVFNGSWVEWM